MTAAVLLLAAALSAAAVPGPLDAPAAEWASKGFTLKDRIQRNVGGNILAVAVYSAADGSGDRLEAYVVTNGKAYLGYSHPAHNDLLEIDGAAESRDFRDLFKDGSRAIGYRSTIRALNADALNILTYKNFKFRLASSFPEGHFIANASGPLVMSRDLPLGRFLSVGCENFAALAQTAFRTRLFTPSKGRFVEVTSRHPALFASEIARKEAALERLKSDLRKNADEYLGLALSVYYDYAARGEARRGWERQKDLFKIPRFAPPSVKTCADAMRADIRGRLRIPASWP